MAEERRPRGFAAMSPERVRELARKGGIAAHEQGTAHVFTEEEARAAGRLGGQTIARDKVRMRKLGQMGAAARRRQRREAELAASQQVESEITPPAGDSGKSE